MTRTNIPAVPRSNALAEAPGESELARVVETSSAAAAQAARTALEARFQMARAFPRVWANVRERLLEACQRPRFAEEARYMLPRGDKSVEGLTVRFAEDAKRALGNLLVEARATFDDEDRRIIQVTVTDLELNDTWSQDVVVEKSIQRRWKKDGDDVIGHRLNSENKPVWTIRASDDDVFLKQNNLVSKTARNGILRMLPADYQEDALVQVKATLQNQARDAANVDRMVKAFAKRGVTTEHLVAYLGHPIAAMEGDEFVTLRGFYQAMVDGDATWDQVLAAAPKHKQGAGRPRPNVRGDGYDAAPKAERKAQATARGGQTPPVETIQMTDKPKPSRPLPPDPYATCPHGVQAGTICVECLQDAEEAERVNLERSREAAAEERIESAIDDQERRENGE
jgi:hypothetical protein